MQLHNKYYREDKNLIEIIGSKYNLIRAIELIADTTSAPRVQKHISCKSDRNHEALSDSDIYHFTCN